MKTLKIYFLFIIFFGLTKMVFGQVGSAYDDFSLPESKSGKEVKLSNFKSSKAVVLIFTGTSCPYDKTYQSRLLDLVKKYETGDNAVKFLMVNPGASEDDKSALNETANTFNLPVLMDTDFSLTNKMNVTKTPEVVVMEQSLGHFVVKYRGAIDDNPQLAEEVKEKYLEKAIIAALEKKNVEVSYQKPVGCMIRK